MPMVNSLLVFFSSRRLRKGASLRRVILSAFVCTTALLGAQTVAWPPRLDKRNTFTHIGNRRVERYLHSAREEWGYEKNQEDYFFLVGPRDSFHLKAPSARIRPNAPLFVFLHSAGHEGLTGLLYGFFEKEDGGFETAISHVPDDFYGLYLDCKSNDTSDWWWGWQSIDRNHSRYVTEMAPTEKRVMDTIAWVVKEYSIDANRIYLSGLSMGGSGALGIGMPRGDIFAAIMVRVPAGTEHLKWRTNWGPEPPPSTPNATVEAWFKTISGVGRPDPPVLVDISSQADAWSKGHDMLLSAARDGRYMIVFGWGPFGHTGRDSEIEKSTPAVMEFPWLDIKRNEAYPAFSHASSDQRAPWLNSPTESDESGQINAFFRWKSIADTPKELTMELRLARANEFTRPINGPKQSVVDVTLRRLQQFKVVAGATYSWKLIRDKEVLFAGRIKPDAANLLTIPKLLVTDTPAQLQITNESASTLPSRDQTAYVRAAF